VRGRGSKLGGHRGMLGQVETSVVRFEALVATSILGWKWLTVAITLAYNELQEWNSTFLEFSLNTEGTTEKVLQFIMPLRQFKTGTLVSLSKKMYF
jgi:hypothetical protein